MTWSLGATVVLTTALLSVLLTGAVRRASLRRDFVARPRTDRHHRSVVPLGGGIALLGALIPGLLAVLVLAYLPFVRESLAGRLTELGIDPAGLVTHRHELVLLSVALGILFIMGLWDDRHPLGPGRKLLIQVAVALGVARFADIRVELFIPNVWITSALSALWIVIVVNAFNFLDNMDGAAAGIAVIVCGVLGAAALSSGQVLVASLTLALAGALLGFLVFNFPPARIFMGDAGSLVVGFLLAVVSLRTTYYRQVESGAMYRVCVPLIALAVPLYDVTSVTILRLCQGKAPWIGDTQHFSHRLRRRGLSERQTALTLYLATLCTGLGATFLYQVDRIGALLIAIQTVLVLIIIAILEAHGSTPTKRPRPND